MDKLIEKKDCLHCRRECHRSVGNYELTISYCEYCATRYDLRSVSTKYKNDILNSFVMISDHNDCTFITCIEFDNSETVINYLPLDGSSPLKTLLSFKCDSKLLNPSNIKQKLETYLPFT